MKPQFLRSVFVSGPFGGQTECTKTCNTKSFSSVASSVKDLGNVMSFSLQEMSTNQNV